MIIVISCFVIIAFLTLIERKFLRFCQYRKGPFKVRIIGILQPIADGVKLFIKERSNLIFRNKFLFLVSPLIAIILIFLLWGFSPLKEEVFSLNYRIIIILMLISINIYPLFFSGWSSNSKYSSLGAVRGICQTLSYEINLTLIFFLIRYLGVSIRIEKILKINIYIFFWELTIIIFPLLFLILVIETNRRPFDFSEGESELVSGFNTEYRGGMFAFIFLAEYARILFFRLIFVVLILNHFLSMLSIFFIIIISLIWIWFRATFPRYRYDLILELNWKFLLPNLILLMLFYINL